MAGGVFLVLIIVLVLVLLLGGWAGLGVMGTQGATTSGPQELREAGRRPDPNLLQGHQGTFTLHAVERGRQHAVCGAAVAGTLDAPWPASTEASCHACEEALGARNLHVLESL